MQAIERIRAAMYHESDDLEFACNPAAMSEVLAHIDALESQLNIYSSDKIRKTLESTISALTAENERLRKDAEQMLYTLTLIRNANPRDWEELSCEATEFERWAKSRANHSITKSAGAAMKGTP